MKKNKNDQLLTAFFILIIAAIVSWITNSSQLKNICTFVLFLMALSFALAAIIGINQSGKSICLSDIRPGVIFELRFVGASKEKISKHKAVDYNMYLLKDLDHTYFWVDVMVFPPGKYIKDQSTGKIIAVALK